MAGALKKTVFIFTLFLLGYYFFFLKPKLELSNKISRTENILSEQLSSLLQNRLSFVELTKLDPASASFDLEKSNLVGTLKSTNEKGLKVSQEVQDIPEIDKDLSKRYKALLSETKEVYEAQNALLEKVFSTGSYESGVELLKSDEAVEILTLQTNLVLEYDFWLRKIQQIRVESLLKE